ncbi:MAG: HEAT repeat domain-containing protein, partial [Burkholderiales bacterium]
MTTKLKVFLMGWVALASAWAGDDLTDRCRTAAGFDANDIWGNIAHWGPQAIDVCNKSNLRDPNNAKVWAYLGRALYLNSQPEDSLRWIRKAAKANSALGQALLGVVYEFGYGIEEDHAEALEWYRRAAEHGQANGQFNLAMSLSGDSYAGRYSDEVVSWLAKSAQSGYRLSALRLGRHYLALGGAKEEEKAKAWLVKALGRAGEVRLAQHVAGVPELASLLAALLGDPVVYLRRDTAIALGNIRSTEAVSALIQALKDPDEEVRENAGWALGQINSHEAVPGLIE